MQLEGPGAIQVSATWTADDDLHSTNLICAETFRLSDALGVGMALLALLTLGSALLSGGITFEGPARLILLVALFLGALSAWYFDATRRVRLHRRKYHSEQGESTYGLDQRGVHWEGDDGHSFARWKAVRAFTETPRFWRFDLTDCTALLIPRAGLPPADDAAIAAAMKLFAGKVGGADEQ
jgi:hypothetical protein